MNGWRVVRDFDRTGRIVDAWIYCPECWPTMAEQIRYGRTPYGRTTISESHTPNPNDWCHGCDRHPEPRVSA